MNGKYSTSLSVNALTNVQINALKIITSRPQLNFLRVHAH